MPSLALGMFGWWQPQLDPCRAPELEQKEPCVMATLSLIAQLFDRLGTPPLL